MSDLSKILKEEYVRKENTVTPQILMEMVEDTLDKIYEEFGRKPEPIQEMASDRAKEFVLSLPKFTPSEAWGDPNSMERQQITRLFNVMGGGRTVEGKLQFLQRIVDPNNRIEFSAKGNLPIQDLIAFEGTDKAVPISLKLLGPKTHVEGSFTNLVDGLDEFGEMVYIVARKDKETGGMMIEKFTFTQDNFMRALITTSKGGTKKTDLLQLRDTDLSTEDSIKYIMSQETWPERYELLQQTRGYSQTVRKKKMAAQVDPQPQQEPDAEPEQQPINESGKGDGGYQWGLSVPQLKAGVLKDMLGVTILGELPYSEEQIVRVARMHMHKLNEEIMQLFTATQDLSENVNAYFLQEKRSSAINSGNRAIQDSVKIQQTLQAQLSQPDDENNI